MPAKAVKKPPALSVQGWWLGKRCGHVIRFRGRPALPLALVVGDALRLGGPGLLGGEGQNHQGDQIGQHPVDMGADAQLGQEEYPVAVDIDAGVGGGDALEQAEEQGRAGDVQGLPVAEDHDGQGQEAEAGHIAGGGAVGGGQGVDEAAHARQGAGDGGAGVAHLVDVDAQGVGGLGILAAGAQPQAEAGLVEQDGQHHKEDNADVGGQVGLVDEGGAEEAHLIVAAVAEHALFDHEPAGRVAGVHLKGVLVGDNADEEQHQGGGHQVEGGAADGLVGLQVHRREGEQQGEQGAQNGRHQHGQQHEALQGQIVVVRLGGVKDAGLLGQVDKEHAREGAEDHNTFQGQVDDAAALGKHAGQGHDHQGDGIDQGLLNEERHACSPPFSGVPSPPSGGAVLTGAGSAAFLCFRWLPLMASLMTREKALR